MKIKYRIFFIANIERLSMYTCPGMLYRVVSFRQTGFDAREITKYHLSISSDCDKRWDELLTCWQPSLRLIFIDLV